MSKDAQYQEAFTGSDSGATLGIFCSIATQHCFAYYSTANQCDEGGHVPVLVNADTGASLFKTTCRSLDTKTGKLYVNVFDDFSIETIMLQARNLGIAIPLEGGQFKAIRFSLMGSNEAIASAKTLPSAIKPAKGDAVF